MEALHLLGCLKWFVKFKSSFYWSLHLGFAKRWSHLAIICPQCGGAVDPHRQVSQWFSTTSVCPLHALRWTACSEENVWTGGMRDGQTWRSSPSKVCQRPGRRRRRKWKRRELSAARGVGAETFPCHCWSVCPWPWAQHVQLCVLILPSTSCDLSLSLLGTAPPTHRNVLEFKN